jgi:hypothetical protein
MYSDAKDAALVGAVDHSSVGGLAMSRDPLVQEIRAIREAYAERFDYDLLAIFRDLKELEQQSGRQIVSPPQLAPLSPVPSYQKHSSP